MLKIVVEAENEKTVVASHELIAALERNYYRSGKHSLKTITDKTITEMTTFTMNPIHPFFEEFNEYIHRMMDAGIVFHKNQFAKVTKAYDGELPALVLSMDDLGIGFIVCLVPLAISIFIFIAEVAIAKIKLFCKAMRDTFIVVLVVTKFLDVETKIQAT